MKKIKVFLKKIFVNALRLFSENSVLVGGMSLTPVIVACRDLATAAVMSIVVVLLMALLTVTSPLITKIVKPLKIRYLAYAVTAAIYYIPIGYFVKNQMLVISDSVGIYLPMLIVSSMVIVIPMNFSQNREQLKVRILDVTKAAVGFVVAAFLVGGVREYLTSGIFFGIHTGSEAILPGAAFSYAGFIIAGMLAALAVRISKALTDRGYKDAPKDEPMTQKPDVEEVKG